MLENRMKKVMNLHLNHLHEPEKDWFKIGRNIKNWYYPGIIVDKNCLTLPFYNIFNISLTTYQIFLRFWTNLATACLYHTKKTK